MKSRRRRAFSIIELLLAAVAGAIVLLAAGVILWGGQHSWNRSWQRMNLQRDAAVALQTMMIYVRPATSMELDADGRGVKIYHGKQQWERFQWPDGSHDLQVQPKDQAARNLVSGTVKQVAFTQEGRLLHIDLVLEQGELSTHLTTAVMMRNSGT